jgi:Helix-turn-helix domain
MPKVIGDLRLYDLDELSAILGMHKKSLTDKYIKTGVIRARKFGVRWYVPEDALKEYFAEKEELLPSLTHTPLQAAQQPRSHSTKHT